MAGVETSRESPSSPHIFSQAVSTVMKDWQALRIAVDNMFGGPLSKEKATWLEQVTVDFMCKNDDVQSWELEDYLSVLMDREFNTSVEDTSIPTISKKICELYGQYQCGNFQSLQEFIAKSQPSPPVKVQCKEEKEEEVDGLDIVEEEEEQSTTSIEIVQEEIQHLQLTEDERRISKVDDEGWEVVRRNHRKSK